MHARILVFMLAMGLGAASALAGETGAGKAATGKKRIGVAIPTADHGWTGGVTYWAKRAVDEWKARDPELEFTLIASADSARQAASVEDLLAKGIDALVILAHESAPLTPVVKKVHQAGVYVVSVDRGLVEPVEDVYIAGDNPGMGRVSAEWLGSELGGKGSLVMLEGIPSVINTERVEGFRAVMKEKFPGIRILDSQPAYWDTKKGLEVMENYLQKYPRFDAVYAQDDDVLTGVLQAYRESGCGGVKAMIGGGGSKAMIKRIMDGDPLVRATVTYPPNMVATGVSLAVWGVRGKKAGELLAPGADPSKVEGFYQKALPRLELPDGKERKALRVILAAELVVKDNAKDYYVPDSPF